MDEHELQPEPQVDKRIEYMVSSDDPASQLAWLRNEIARQLSSYRRRRRRDKRKAFALQMATVTLSAAITVLLGLQVTEVVDRRLADIALAFGALITVLAAYEAFFGHRELWILRTHTVRRLEALERHVDYYQAGLNERPPQATETQQYLKELEDVINNDHGAWQELRRVSPPPQRAGPT